jgi:hypothetical protein
VGRPAGELRDLCLDHWSDLTDDRAWTWVPFQTLVHAERSFGDYTISSPLQAAGWVGPDREFEFLPRHRAAGHLHTLTRYQAWPAEHTTNAGAQLLRQGAGTATPNPFGVAPGPVLGGTSMATAMPWAGAAPVPEAAGWRWLEAAESNRLQDPQAAVDVAGQDEVAGAVGYTPRDQGMVGNSPGACRQPGTTR